MNDLVDLKGRNALITGAGQGVGRAIALLMAEHNAGTVFVNDLFEDRAEAVATEINDAGGSAVGIAADVTDYDSIKAMAARVGEIGEPAQIIVNNAGLPPAGFPMKPFHESEPEEWEKFIRLNLYGPMYVTRAFIEPMIERGWGRVVTIISDAARVGDPFMAWYAAGKAGAAGFMRSIANETGKLGVNCNCISLGSIFPGFDPEVGLAEEMKRRFRGYALRRPGTPEDVAPMVVFLSSDASSWITGQVYPVNGGYSFAV